MKRLLKQLAYLGLFVGFVGGVLWLLYATLFAAPPSCFDSKQNQGEEGVDCGGPCRAFCLPTNPTPPAALGTPRVFRPSDELVAVLIELKNSNSAAALRQVSYQVTVRGDAGTPLQIKGVASLYASEVRRLVLVRPAGSLSGFLEADLTIATTSAQWASAQQFQKPDLEVVNALTSETPEGVRVEGTIASDDALGVTDVTIIALFYDTTGSLLGASQTVLPRLAAGDTEQFTISYPSLPGIDTEATQVSVTAYRP